MTEIVMWRGRIGVHTFVDGLRLPSKGRPVFPLTVDQALEWAIEFEQRGWHAAANEIFEQLCAGRPVFRHL